MDIELIIYLIFLAVALLSRFLKKKKPTGPATSDTQRPRRPAKSFEELLEEFTNPEPEPASNREVSREEPARAPDPEMEEERVPIPDSDFSFEPQEKLRTLDELVDINKTRTTTRLVAEEEEAPEDPAGQGDRRDGDQSRQEMLPQLHDRSSGRAPP
jgi:hypothetical protein